MKTTKSTIVPATAQADEQAQALKTMTPAEMASTIQALISANATPATIHNVLLRAQALSAELVASGDPVLVQSQSGYNAGGFRKPLMQAVAQALGVIPVLKWVETNPVQPKQVGQQPAFFGPAQQAQLASATYSALFSWVNVQGNKALRAARAVGKSAGRSGQAGDRLQQDVYNLLACSVLDTLSKVKALPVNEALVQAFGKLGAKKCKGGIVFSGAYDTKRYDGSLLLIK